MSSQRKPSSRSPLRFRAGSSDASRGSRVFGAVPQLAEPGSGEFPAAARFRVREVPAQPLLR